MTAYTAADDLDLARIADTLLADPAAGGFQAQMREALDGEFPDGADPVQVCIDDIHCALSVAGYVLRRQRDPATLGYRYTVEVAEPGIVGGHN